MGIISIIVASLLALSAVLSFSAHRYIRDREIGIGRVSDLIAVRSQKGTTYKISASFTDQAGTSHVYRSSFSSSNPGYKIGDPIRICYKADDPADSGIYSFGYRFGVAWVIFTIAVVFGLSALGYRHGQRLMDAIYLTHPGLLELR